MAGSQRTLNGIYAAVVAVGAYLIWTGIQDVGIVDGIRELIKGKTPTGKAPEVTNVDLSQLGGGALGEVGSSGQALVPAPTSLNSSIVTDVRKYIGIPYKTGGASPAGFDCSGLVQYVLRHDLGLAVPASVRRVRDFVRWSGATTIPKAKMAPGDLVCWDFVHMGIATGNGKMINAAAPGTKVREQTIWSNPPPTHIRRVTG